MQHIKIAPMTPVAKKSRRARSKKPAFFVYNNAKTPATSPAAKQSAKQIACAFAFAPEIQLSHLKMRFANEVGEVCAEYLRALTCPSICSFPSVTSRFFTARFCPETVNVSPFRRITTVLSVKVGTSSTPVTLIACRWSSSTLCEDFCAVLAACSMAF